MNMKSFSKPVLALFVAAGLTVNAGSSWQSEVAKLLKEVPLPELTTRATQIVQNAPENEQSEATVAVVKAVLAKSPSSAAALVGSISRANPKMAAVAASTASALKPSQARQITAAAVQSAPAHTKQVVHDTAKSIPTQYNNIAVAAASVNPSASKEILSAISTAVPTIKSYVDVSSKASVAQTISLADRQVVEAASKSGVTPSTFIAGVDTGIRGAPTPSGDFQPTPVVTTTFDSTDANSVPPGTKRRISSDGTLNQ